MHKIQSVFNDNKIVKLAGWFLLITELSNQGYAQVVQRNCPTGCIQITATRLTTFVKPPSSGGNPVPVPAPAPTPTPPRVEPPPAPAPIVLAAPVFSPQNGGIAFGTAVAISASNIPVGATIEYSTDNGASWVGGNQLVVNRKVNVIGRVRAGNQVSTTTTASFSPYFQRMLVLGNSIMNMGPVPDLGWFNSNGMAASAPEKDFLHLLTARLQTLYPAINTFQQTGGLFERNYGKPDYSLDEFNESIDQFKPDLILVRIGENIDDSQVGSRNFDETSGASWSIWSAGGGRRPVKIICTTSVWSNPQSDAVVRRVTVDKGHTLVDLVSLVGQPKNFASQYTNPAVAAHPNDTGMQRIADLIWDKLK